MIDRVIPPKFVCYSPFSVPNETTHVRKWIIGWHGCM